VHPVTLRYVAPAGAPIGVRHLARWAGSMRDGDPNARLAEAVATTVGIRHAWTTCTGRAGLTVLMRALRRIARPEADEVIVPAYTCYSVPASIVRAGLRPRLVDVDPDSLDYDRAALAAADTSRVLAVVATNLYGIPNDLPHLVAFGRERGVFVVDDAAQALGAVSSGRPAGTWGDAGLFSLDKGKNVSAIDGGVLVTGDDRVAEALRAEVATLEGPSTSRRAEHVVKALVYATLLHPRLYWMPNAIPQLGLGRTLYTTEFAIERQDPGLAALGSVMLRELEAFTAARRGNAAGLLAAIGPAAGIQVPATPPASQPAWLRLPLLVSVPGWRDRLVAALTAAGIGATTSYPAALIDVPELRASLAGEPGDCPGARTVATRILTLPTHPYVTPPDIRTVARVVRAVIGSAPVAATARPATS
jgi:dTDP-4-amino-4,6-dideoxygalactose transaminase